MTTIPPIPPPRRRYGPLIHRFIDRFIKFLMVAPFSALVVLAVWVYITLPSGSGDPRAPVAGPAPRLGWFLSILSILPSSKLAAAPVKCGPFFLYVPLKAGPDASPVIVAATPPDDRAATHIDQLAAFDPAHTENGRYRSLYQPRSYDRAALRPLPFAALPASHVEGRPCLFYNPLKLHCAPGRAFC